MRKILVLFLLLIGTKLFPQAPQKISYQAVARDGSGNIVTTSIGIKFQIYQGSVSGSLVYEETHTATPSSAGIFTVHIGGGSVVTGNFSTINWGISSYFLQVSIDPNGGTSYSTVGANQLVSVPYALYANSAGSAPSPTLAFGSGVLSVGSNTVSIPTSGTYSAGTGIAINSGSIINTAPAQTVNLTGVGVSTVTGTHPNFTVDVAAASLTYNNSTKELTLSQGGATSTATLSGTGTNTISIVGTGVANITPAGAGSNFTVNVPSPIIIGQGGTTVMGVWPNFTISSTPSTSYIAGSGISITGNTISNTAPNQTVSLTGLGSTTVTGTYPNYSISTPIATITPPPTITGAGITTVTSVGPNFTVNTAPVNMTYLPGTGVLSYSQAIGTNTVNLNPALTFTNGILGVGANTITIPGSGLWSRPTNSATILSNNNDWIGIGINSPTTKIHLNDTSTSTNLSGFSSSPRTSLRIHNNDLTTNNFSSLIFSTLNTGSGLYEAAKIAGVNTNHTAGSITGDLAFLTRFPSGLIERMRLTSSGYLGLGIINPAQLLHLYSSGTNVGIAIDAGTSGRARLGILAGGVDNGEIGYTNHLTFGSLSNSSLVMSNEWMRLTNNGNLGIGTTNPVSKLHVNGVVTITDGTQGAGEVLTSDAAGGASWQPVSIVNHANISCQNVTNVTNVPAKFPGNLISINKTYADTKLEVIVQTDINVFDLVGSNCVRYELRVNGIAAVGTTGRANYFWDNNGSTAVTNDRSVTIIGEFLSLAPGSYNVELWVSCPFGGSAVNAYIDPGCFSSSSVIVKEYK